MKNKIAVLLWIMTMIAVSVLSTANEVRADEEEPSADYCPEITLLEVHPCKFRYTISTMEEFGEDARAERAILVERDSIAEWFGDLRQQIIDITLVDLFQQRKLTYKKIFILTTNKMMLDVMLEYYETVDLFDVIRSPDWKYLQPQVGDDEKAILEKTGTGEWLIVDVESFDAVSREFTTLNIAYYLAVLVEVDVIRREDATAYGISAMSHEEYLKTKESFGELY